MSRLCVEGFSKPDVDELFRAEGCEQPLPPLNIECFFVPVSDAVGLPVDLELVATRMN